MLVPLENTSLPGGVTAFAEKALRLPPAELSQILPNDYLVDLLLTNSGKVTSVAAYQIDKYIDSADPGMLRAETRGYLGFHLGDEDLAFHSRPDNLIWVGVRQISNFRKVVQVDAADYRWLLHQMKEYPAEKNEQNNLLILRTKT